MSSALPALVLALVPGLVGPLKTSQSHRAHRLSAHSIASITASPLEATAVELRPETAVQLLTTPPELMPAALGTTAAQSDGIWAALRKGLDPLEDAVVEAPVGLQLNSRHVATRTQRKLRAACAPVRAGNVTAESRSDSAGTHKLLVELRDGLAVECVLIPMGRHTSVCVSSQVGCARACRFCSTGTMGLVRNLDAHEIVHQVWLAQRFVREQRLPQLVNVVFMGMGEPLNNLAAV